ncbi:MAG: APC family permease [Actinomycetota bacterium]
MGSEEREFGYERLGAKKLSLIDVIAQSVGFMGPVFSAAFLIPLIAGFSASGKGAGVATPFAVLLAAIGTFALGWIVAQYAKRVHAAGSLYDYVSMGLGGRAGAATGWLYYGGTTVLASAIAVLVGWFVHDVLFLGVFGTDSPLPMWAWSVVYVAAVFAIMYLGVQISTRVQLALALVSAAVFLLFFLKVIIDVGGDNSLKAFNPSEAADGWSGILFGVLYGVLIFVGFETAANLAEETAEPKRSIPRAVLLTVAIVAAFYLIAAYAQVAGFGFDPRLILNPEIAAAPVFALGSFDFFGSNLILKVLEVVVLLDIMAVGLGAAVASTRGIFALARDRRIPGALAAVSRTRGTPVGAIVFVEAFSLLMVLFAEVWDGLFALPQTPHYFAMFLWLSTFGGFALMIVYGLMALGAFKGLAGHPNTVGVVVAALIGVALAAGAVFGGIYKQPNPFDLVWIYVAGWLILGIIVTSLVKGREPASQVLADLSSGPTTPTPM